MLPPPKAPKSQVDRALLILSGHMDGYIKGHMSQSGTSCFRIMSEKHEPIQNISALVMETLKEENYVTAINRLYFPTEKCRNYGKRDFNK